VREDEPLSERGEMVVMKVRTVVPMKTLFEAATLEVATARIACLRPDSEWQWGKMNAAQMLAHCAARWQWV
jgi:hypothetical protein